MKSECDFRTLRFFPLGFLSTHPISRKDEDDDDDDDANFSTFRVFPPFYIFSQSPRRRKAANDSLRCRQTKGNRLTAEDFCGMFKLEIHRAKVCVPKTRYVTSVSGSIFYHDEQST